MLQAHRQVQSSPVSVIHRPFCKALLKLCQADKSYSSSRIDAALSRKQEKAAVHGSRRSIQSSTKPVESSPFLQPAKPTAGRTGSGIRDQACIANPSATLRPLPIELEPIAAEKHPRMPDPSKPQVGHTASNDATKQWNSPCIYRSSTNPVAAGAKQPCIFKHGPLCKDPLRLSTYPARAVPLTHSSPSPKQQETLPVEMHRTMRKP